MFGVDDQLKRSQQCIAHQLMMIKTAGALTASPEAGGPPSFKGAKVVHKHCGVSFPSLIET